MYKVTIEKTEIVESITPRIWVKGATEGRSDAQSEYGYTPQIPTKVERTVTVAELRFTELDVFQLVGASLDYGKAC